MLCKVQTLHAADSVECEFVACCFGNYYSNNVLLDVPLCRFCSPFFTHGTNDNDLQPHVKIQRSSDCVGRRTHVYVRSCNILLHRFVLVTVVLV
jgi:hypothetical protein